MTDRIESVHSGDNFYHCLSYDLKQIRFFSSPRLLETLLTYNFRNSINKLISVLELHGLTVRSKSNKNKI